MKVVHLSSSDLSGGASIACKRISEALRLIGVDSQLLVQKKISSDPTVFTTSERFLSKLKYDFRFMLDEGFIRLFTIQSRGRFSYPKLGIDISRHPLITTSDIIHLHWINGGFISIDSLKKIGRLNKPIVWTLHDMWAFTGGCHYSLECTKFEEECRNCPTLKFPSENDLSKKIFNEKKFFDDINLTLVTCSDWLKHEAEKSPLFNGKKVFNIPNPLNTEKYVQSNKKEARHKLNLNENKFYILFGAMNTLDERKGLNYLINSLKNIATKSDKYKEKIGIIIFGKSNDKILSNIPFQKYYFGNVKSENEIVDCYNAADIFVLSSMQDNLPNTVLESLSCGTPVVAFNVGGLSDMIDHLKNGYLANSGSIDELTDGILWYLENIEKYKEQSFNARRKVIQNFTQEIVGEKYKELYQNLI